VYPEAAYVLSSNSGSILTSTYSAEPYLGLLSYRESNSHIPSGGLSVVLYVYS